MYEFVQHTCTYTSTIYDALSMQMIIRVLQIKRNRERKEKFIQVSQLQKQQAAEK